MNITKTIIITGASSGIGRETVKYFSNKGWNIAATMRNPSSETELTKLANVTLYALDVTSNESINNAIEQIWKKFKKINVVVNNAGYGLIGTFEGATDEQIQNQFNTNVFGLMRVTRAALPHLRLQGYGCIINISSIAGIIPLPLYSLYNASKFAIEGFTESLHYELKQFNIKVKLIEPGPIDTNFNSKSKIEINSDSLPEYQEYEEYINNYYNKNFKNADLPLVVSKKIYKAATTNSNKIRYTAGLKAKLFITLAKLFPNFLLRNIVDFVTLRK